jgi:hypothetical protein
VTDAAPRALANPAFPAGVHAGIKNSVAGGSQARLVTLHTHSVQIGPLLPVGWWFEPGEKYDTHFLVHVPTKPRVSQVQLRVAVAIAQGVRLQLSAPSFGPRECKGKPMKTVPAGCPDLPNGLKANVTMWDIPRESLLRRITTDKRYVFAELVQQAPRDVGPTPFLGLLIDRDTNEPGHPTAEVGKIESSYSLREEDSYFELELKSASRPNQK